MIDLKKLAAGAAIAGMIGLGAIGMGTGLANAAPHGAPLPQDRGHGHDDWRGDDWRGDDWRRANDWERWDGPRYWDPVQACIVAGGPFGYVQGSICI